MQGRTSIPKTALLHFLPLELYPPVMNLLNEWISKEMGLLHVYTTPCWRPELSVYRAGKAEVSIKRYGSRRTGQGFLLRMLHYWRYYSCTLLQLIIKRPDTVFYYDTISSFPAWCYKVFFNRSCRLFIHYHEYMSREEYVNGMVLLRWFHKLEKYLYARAEWVSHTNTDRMQLFLADMPGVQVNHCYILPNYPPLSWATEKKGPVVFPVRFIQVGALDMEMMYTKEFAEWIIQQQGRAVWDIYSLTINDGATAYFKTLHTDLIHFKGSVDYNALPAVLSQYDVGLILYKGHIPNYIYNAPNKLFEYYLCGLDVWLPAQMVTAARYATSHTFPRIVPLVFENLSLYSLEELVNRRHMQYYKETVFCAENALKELINKIGKIPAQ